MPSLLETVSHLLRQDDNLDKLGAMLGIEADRASTLVDLATPVLITGLADRAFEPGGSDVVVRLLDGIDPSIVENPLIFVERGDAAVGEGLLVSIFAGEQVGLKSGLARTGDVPETVIARLLPGILALAIGVLGRRRAVRGVDEAGVLELLATEKSVLPADRLVPAGGVRDGARATRVPAMAETAASVDAATSTAPDAPAETAVPGSGPESDGRGDRAERRSTPAAIDDGDDDAADPVDSEDSGTVDGDGPATGGDGRTPVSTTDGGPASTTPDGERRGPLLLILGGLAAVLLLAWTLSRLVGDEATAADVRADDAADTVDRSVDDTGDDSSVDTSPDGGSDAGNDADGGQSATGDTPVEGGQQNGETDTTRPVDESVEPVTINEQLSLDPITFEVRSANITPEGLAVLDEAAEYLQADPAVTVEIAGHTDSDGDASDNLRLSQDRADVVKAYLESLGIEGARMTPIGYGEQDPIASNDTEAGKAQNRRIEFVIQ